jgi:glycosyltransferase involved in cell wall biosynthesis
MGLEAPLICSNIKENLYIVEDTAVTFRKGDVYDLTQKMNFALKNPEIMMRNAKIAKLRVSKKFTWEKVTDDHVRLINWLCR